jgi:LmbE family N-acetylglucosaminyl deacetylase
VSEAPGPGSASGLPVGDLLDDGPATVGLPVPASALAIGAHPDDIEFGCGATLARWARAGCRVHHLVLTDGSKGSWDPDADLEELVADRAAECLEAAAVLDGEPALPDDRVVLLGRVDGELADDVATRRDVAAAVRHLRPEVVLGHDPWRRYRLHPDHRHAGFLTIDALVAARDPHFFPELGLDPHRASHLLLWEADLPNHVEPADGFEAVKVEALLVHASQQRSTMGIDGRGDDEEAAFAAKVRRQLRDHGAVAGIGSGEAFRHLSDL